MELIHGGDTEGFRRQFGRPPLDFSASLNPLGMPPAAAAAARRAVDAAVPYPDPLCRRLTAAMASRLGIPAEWIFCGNGAADVIFRLAQALQPKTALLPAPSFAEYGEALRSCGSRIRLHTLRAETGFRLEEDILPAITPDLDILFLCQPNNPTGHLIPPELLRRILGRCTACGVILAADECFLGLVRNGERWSLLPDAAASPNLFILGSFTKLYGMAGIRLGYGICSDPAVIAGLHRAGQPWTVSVIAQEAGMAALGEEEFVRETLNVIEAERPRLAAGLCEAGAEVLGGEANYLFFRHPDTELLRKLAAAGILIRDCRNFAGLGPGYYRAAVRTADENRRLTEALRRIHTGKGE